MKKEIRQNIENKSRLILAEVLKCLNSDLESMLILNASKGMILSGRTIKEAIDFISKGNKNYYQEIINHVTNLEICYQSSLEADIENLARNTQLSFKKEAIKRFEEVAVKSNNQQLSQKMIPNIEKEMEHDLESFKNKLNLIVINLKSKRSESIWNLFKDIFLNHLKEIVVALATIIIWYFFT